MCMSSTPSTAAPATSTPEYLHNPFLDGATIAGAGFTRGRNSLVVDPTTPPSGAGVQSPMINPAMSGVPNTKAPALVSAGTVIPTIGGSMAGALPNSVTVAGNKQTR